VVREIEKLLPYLLAGTKHAETKQAGTEWVELGGDEARIQALVMSRLLSSALNYSQPAGYRTSHIMEHRLL
jgi:hypothetical protein